MLGSPCLLGATDFSERVGRREFLISELLQSAGWEVNKQIALWGFNYPGTLYIRIHPDNRVCNGRSRYLVNTLSYGGYEIAPVFTVLHFLSLHLYRATPNSYVCSRTYITCVNIGEWHVTCQVYHIKLYTRMRTNDHVERILLYIVRIHLMCITRECII